MRWPRPLLVLTLASLALAAPSLAARKAVKAKARAPATAKDLQIQVLAGEPITAPLPPGVVLQTFPPLPDGSGQFMLHGCRVDLRALIDGRASGGIRFVAVMNLGSGSWYVVTTLASPAMALKVDLVQDTLALSVTPAVAPTPGEPQPITLATLLGGAVPAESHPKPTTPVLFLSGSALAPAVDPDTYTPILPVFSPPGGPTGWDAVTTARLEWLEDPEGPQRGRALMALAKAFLDVGFFREASHYFRLLEADPADQPPWLVSLARARADMGVHRWDDTRQDLLRAVQAGAPDNLVLEPLALVSHATGVPPRGPTGRLLAATCLRPEAQLVAAELLQLDGAWQESLALLVNRPGELDEVATAAWNLRLGDALLATGDIPGAETAYAGVPGDLGRSRGYLAEVSGRPPTRWPELIPKLETLTLEPQPASAETLYMLAQVKQEVWDIPGALEDLDAIMDRFPGIARLSDVPSNLWSLYKVRLQELSNEERWFDVAVLHEDVWSDLLASVVKDATPLDTVARAYEKLGLPQEAMEVLVDAFQVILREDAHQPHLVFHLARLYADAGQDEEAIETLDWLEKKGVPEDIRGPKALLAAQVQERLGRTVDAQKSLRAAGQFPETRSEAQLHFALLDARAGKCKSAISSLWLQLMPQQRRDRDLPTEPYLTLARCLITEGRYAEAGEAAREAARRASEPSQTQEAVALAAAADKPTGDGTAPATPAGATQEDIWALVKKENEEAAAFEKIISRFK